MNCGRHYNSWSSPHPALSKGEGSEKEFLKSEAEVLSFGEDLGEAKRKPLSKTIAADPFFAARKEGGRLKLMTLRKTLRLPPEKNTCFDAFAG